MTSSKKQMESPQCAPVTQSVENFTSLTNGHHLVSKSGESGDLNSGRNQDVRQNETLQSAGSPIEFLKRFKMQKKVCQKQFEDPQAPHEEVLPDETVVDGEQAVVEDQTLC